MEMRTSSSISDDEGPRKILQATHDAFFFFHLDSTYHRKSIEFVTGSN